MNRQCPMARKVHHLLVAGLMSGLLACSPTDDPEPREDGAEASPPGNAVATAHPRATEAALEVLDAGGNAFDAAVAATAALGVVEPFGSGLGGGGFWLLHRADDDRSVMIDGRETAPDEAHREMYLDEDGEPREGASLDGPLAAAIPGTPAALVRIAGKYGDLPLRRSLRPAIELAREGFEVGERYRTLMEFRQEAVAASPAAAEVFLDDGEVPPEGARIVQEDLAVTLEQLARDAGRSFYRGALAERMVEEVRSAGGIWREEDLAAYRAAERRPIRVEYAGAEVTAAALPSAGGIGLATMLQILERLEWTEHGEVEQIHLAVEAMRRAYRDRADHLGDPDFVDVPVARLTGPEHARELSADIDPERATPSEELPQAHAGGGRSTTHFSIIDGDGNRVGATLSINYPFGSGFMPEGTGVILNNEMDDFATAPGEPNAYGLVGGEANAVEGGKRPLSSMTPTFVDTGERVAVLGSPGGSRIITQVLLGVLAFTEEQPVDEWVAAPRYHHQYLPDRIEHEPGAFPGEVRRRLEAKGHELHDVGREYGDMHVVIWDRGAGTLETGTDPRGEGGAGVGETEREAP